MKAKNVIEISIPAEVKMHTSIYTDDKSNTVTCYEFNLKNAKLDAKELGKMIHNKLVGYLDYIDNNIVLNCTSKEDICNLYVFSESKTEVKIIK